MLIVRITLSLLATVPGIKLEEVIAQENMQQEKQLTIDENLHGGKILVLSDGSTWEVAPQSLSTSQSWIFPSPLKIENSKNPAYPYQIISIQTNTSILVRKIAPYKAGGLDIQIS